MTPARKTIYQKAVEVQRKLASKVIRYDDFKFSETFCGADVAYNGDLAFSAAVVMNRKLDVLESREGRITVRYPYVPGLFMLREAPIVKKILSRIETPFDILLIDGHGILHPRRCGLASYLGVTLNLPAIGVAKSLLCGTVRNDNFVEHEGEILGYALRHGTKSAYVSVGHKVSLDSAVEIVAQLTRQGQFLPEPLRLADEKSKQYKRRKEKMS
jgi:deoxyribonuclease V